MTEFKEKLQAYQARIEAAIDKLLPGAETRPSRIHQAMLYSMKAGGKRLRPVLALSTSELFAPELDALPAAIAIESLHTYTLIHDDLPSIDNGDLRRGKPTCHRQFDEPTAVLAGDALLTYAFQLLSRHYADSPSIACSLVQELSKAAGSQKLIGGQMEDILGEKAPISASDLEFIHLNKTSALIECSLVMGGIIGQAPQDLLDTLRAFGREIGIAFQIIDDVLDATSDAKTLGKNAGADASLEKSTYVTLYGLEESRAMAGERTRKALELCKALPNEAPFHAGLASYLEQRLN